MAIVETGPAKVQIRRCSLWDTQSLQSQGELKGHTNYVTSVAFSPRNRERLASGSLDLCSIYYGTDIRCVFKRKMAADISLCQQQALCTPCSFKGAKDFEGEFNTAKTAR